VYDSTGRGNLLEIQTCTVSTCNFTSGAGIATVQLSYNDDGNLLSITTPPNQDGRSQRLDYGYDTTIRRYVTSVRNAFGDQTSIDYDLKFGLPTVTTDMHDASIWRYYDKYGRLERVFGPYDSLSGTPAISMTYFHDVSPARAETVNHASKPSDYTGSVPADIKTVIIVDGLDRAVQTQKTTTVNGTVGLTLEGPVKYDNLGRVKASYFPFFKGTSVPAFTYPPSIDPMHPTTATTVTYDTHGRVVQTVYPDASQDLVSYSIGTAPGVPGASSTPNLFKTSVTAPNGNVRDSYADLRGLTMAVVEYPVRNNFTNKATSRYSYNALGELLTIKDNAGNTSTLGYDLRGLNTSINNPDTGLITMSFDLMGNLTSKIEPNHRVAGTSILYTYDLDRLGKIDYPNKADVLYDYGTTGNERGRIQTIEDETGSQTFTYGSMGEVRRLDRLVTRQTGYPSLSFTTRTTYDSMGRLLQLIYPDGEKLTYAYNAGGQVVSATGAGNGWTKTYASGLLYNVFGNRTSSTLGNDLISEWTYHSQTQRLQRAHTYRPGTLTKYTDLLYTYDPSGNPTGIVSDMPPPGGTGAPVGVPGNGNWTFQYDGMDRLTYATGTQTKPPVNGVEKSTNYAASFGYDTGNINNIISKYRQHAEVSGTAPNATTTYPAATQIDPAMGYTYSTAHPHQPTSVGSTTMTYDASGNLKQTVNGSSVTTMVWDDDNRLAQVTNALGVMTNYYDASGLRVIKYGSRGGETIFVSPYFDVQDEGRQQVKHVFVNGSRVASTTGTYMQSDGSVPPTAQGTRYYFLSDHLGSTSLITNESRVVQEHLEYFPDGEVWIDQNYNTSLQNGYTAFPC
jgi:YD repeat-containing protein